MIEVMAFKLAEGQSKEAFEALNQQVQTEYAPKQPGMIRRTTGLCDDGWWVVVIEWRSKEDNQAALKNAWGKDPVTAQFGNYLDASTISLKEYDTPSGVFGS